MEKGVLPTPFLITQNPPPITHYPKPNSPQPTALWAVGLRFWVLGTGFWVLKDGERADLTPSSLTTPDHYPEPTTQYPLPQAQ